MSVAAPLAALTEKEWDTQLFSGPGSLAATLGWTLRYHVLRSKGSQPGFPDRVLVRDRIMYVETKTEKGKPSEEQVGWLDALARAGGEVYLWRPRDLDEAARVLSGRWELSAGGTVAPGRWLLRRERVGGVTSTRERWTPGSLWLPGIGRADSLGIELEDWPG